MVERDANIPPLDELLAEVQRTREIAAEILSADDRDRAS